VSLYRHVLSVTTALPNASFADTRPFVTQLLNERDSGRRVAKWLEGWDCNVTRDGSTLGLHAWYYPRRNAEAIAQAKASGFSLIIE
jgi:hypothetical protein